MIANNNFSSGYNEVNRVKSGDQSENNAEIDKCKSDYTYT